MVCVFVLPEMLVQHKRKKGTYFLLEAKKNIFPNSLDRKEMPGR